MAFPSSIISVTRVRPFVSTAESVDYLAEWAAVTSGILGSPLVWSTDRWTYDGDYGGGNGQEKELEPTGTWAVGFRPSNMVITFVFATDCPAEDYLNFAFHIRDASFNYIWPFQTQLDDIGGGYTFDHMLSAGTYEITIPLDFTGVGDIARVGFFSGQNDSSPPVDRTMEITAINFT